MTTRPTGRDAGRQLAAAVIALLSWFSSPAATAEGDCPVVFTPEDTVEVIGMIDAAALGEGCTLEGVAAEMATLTASFTTPAGEFAVVIRPAECADASATHLGALAATVPTGLEAHCAGVGDLFGAAEEIGTERSSIVGERGDLGGRVLAWSARAALLMALLATLLAVHRRWRRGPLTLSAPWRAAVLVPVAVALIVRLSVEGTLSNWYSEVLVPGSGLQSSRFGYGAFAIQEWVAFVLPWSDRTWFATTAVIGALAVGVVVLLLRGLRMSPAAAAAVGLLVAVTPLHVRISASTSEHVVSGSALLLAWLFCVHGCRPVRVPMLVAAVAWTVLACLTRADAWAHSALIPVWALLPFADRTVRDPSGPRGAWVGAVGYASAWLLIGVVTYTLVVERAVHPFPEPQAMRYAAQTALVHFWWVANEPPHWFGRFTLVLVAFGCIRMAWRRPGLLACAVATVVAAFVVMGRTFAVDHLVGSRYFFHVIPLVLLPAGFAFEWLVHAIARRTGRETVVTAVLGVVLLAGATLEARSAYRYRYAFQDEYAFLRDALAEIEPDCVVYQLPIRRQGFERDLDCCLDLPRSPMPAAYPAMTFAPLDLASPPAPEPDTCTVWFAGAPCGFDPDAFAGERNPVAVRTFAEECAAVGRLFELDQIAAGFAAPEATQDLFSADPLDLALYRVVWNGSGP